MLQHHQGLVPDYVQVRRMHHPRKLCLLVHHSSATQKDLSRPPPDRHLLAPDGPTLMSGELLVGEEGSACPSNRPTAAPEQSGKPQFRVGTRTGEKSVAVMVRGCTGII